MILNPYRYAVAGSVTALLHMDGSDASTTFTDQKGSTWTAHGNAQIDTAQSKFGGASALFDGTGDYIDTPDSANWEFGAGDFTVECFIRPNTVPVTSGNYRTIFCHDDISSTRGWLLIIDGDSAGKFNFGMRDGTTSYNVSSTAAPSPGEWVHLAVSRSGTSLRMFVGGVLESTTSVGTASINDVSYPLIIGALKQGGGFFASGYLDGWIDEVRITKGLARYTATFTPPSAPFPDS